MRDRRRTFLPTGLGALSVVGALTLVGRAAAADRGAESTPPDGRVDSGHVAVPLGRPIHAQALHYTELFDEKPFAEALLIYLDNGSYKILSPGEDHYGSYLSSTGYDEPPREVSFLSWPSSDWGGDVALHTLVFDPESGAFSQALRLPGQPVPRVQYGYAASLADPTSIDMTVGWDVLRSRYGHVFSTLAEQAG
jgi:hypothetical protein